MNSWRTYKKLSYNNALKTYKNFIKPLIINNVNGSDLIQKTYLKNAKKILHNKKLRWIDRLEKIKDFNQKTINTINNNFGYVLKSFNKFKHLKFVEVNEPNDINKFYQFINLKDIQNENPKTYINNNEPVSKYNFKVESEEQIKEDLKEFLKHIPFPSKILIQFNGVVERSIDNDEYEYFDLIYKGTKASSAAVINSIKDIDIFLNNGFVKGLNTTIENFYKNDSKSKLSVIYGVDIIIYPLGTIGEYIPEISLKYSGMYKKIKLYNCNDNLCFFAAYVYYLLSKKQIKCNNPSPLNNQFRTFIKKVFDEFYNIEARETSHTENIDFKNYQGIKEDEIKIFCDKYDLKIIVYNFNENIKFSRIYGNGKNTYSIIEEVLASTTPGVKNGNSHFMFCEDINKLSELIFCPICHIRSYKNNKKGRKNLKKHILKCDGEIKPVLKDIHLFINLIIHH